MNQATGVRAGLEVRDIRPDEIETFFRVMTRSLGFPMPNEGQLDFARRHFASERNFAAFDGGRMVGTAGAPVREFTLPGPVSAPAAAVTRVAVEATDRRRGVLTAMMSHQLRQAREEGLALSILVASESVIYGRFGYGLASSVHDLRVQPRGLRFVVPEPPLTPRLLTHEEADEILPAAFDRARRAHPGQIERAASWWEYWRLERSRDEHVAVVEDASGVARGFARYTMRSSWDDAAIPDTTMEARDVIWETGEAGVAIWRYLLGIDLVRTIRMHARPMDEPLRWMLDDPRRVTGVGPRDFLWVRFVDVAAALASRRYAVPGRLIVDVTSDDLLPGNGGVWALEVGDDGMATVQRADAAPDVSCGIADLGAAFFGGVTFSALARAGRVREERAGGLVRADTLFSSGAQPWCATLF